LCGGYWDADVVFANKQQNPGQRVRDHLLLVAAVYFSAAVCVFAHSMHHNLLQCFAAAVKHGNMTTMRVKVAIADQTNEPLFILCSFLFSWTHKVRLQTQAACIQMCRQIQKWAKRRQSAKHQR
jgi:hypothetical protein